MSDKRKYDYRIPCPKCGKSMWKKASACWDCTWEHPVHLCPDCGKKMTRGGRRCFDCHKAKIKAPDYSCQDCGAKVRKDAIRCRTCDQAHRSASAKKWMCVDCGVPVKRKVKRCPDCHTVFRKTVRKGIKLSPETRQRMSEAQRGKPKPKLKGRKRSAETRRKMREGWTDELRDEKSQAWSGENNPGYIHGNGRRAYPREFSAALRTSIRKRDNYTCQICHRVFAPRSKGLSVHHVDYDKTNNAPSNLIALCKSCHGKTNFDREKWQKQLAAT